MARCLVIRSYQDGVVPRPDWTRSARTRYPLAALPTKQSRVAVFPIRQYLVGFVRNDDEEIGSTFHIGFLLPSTNGVLYFDYAALDELSLRIGHAHHQWADKTPPSTDKLTLQARDLVDKAEDFAAHVFARALHDDRIERFFR